MASQEDAVHWIFAWLVSHKAGLELLAVGHRVVHGGPIYGEPVVIDGPTLEALTAFVPLAPLHQPHNLAPIRALASYRPGLTQVACFDTAFHRTAPLVAEVYALPREYFDAGVRRYGFHGLSYEYVTHALEELDPAVAAGRVVMGHLGNGCSMAAVRGGKSVGTTMGFTALDGLPMGTRCGQIDPGVLIYLMQQRGMTVDQVEDLLYHHSGLKGLSGISNDMRDLLASDQPGAKLAVDHFVYRIGLRAGRAGRGAGRPGRAGVHRRHRRARRRDPRGSAATRPGWASRSTRRPTAAAARGSRKRVASPRPGSSPPMRN